MSYCGFCGKSHATESCPEVIKLDITGRKNHISEAKLCFRCLLKGHIAKGCVVKCTNCNGSGHHKICCFGEKAPEENGDTCAPEKVVKDSEHEVTLLCRTKQDNVYTVLQTARVLVCGNKLVEATMLFDSGSDRTYISSDLVKRAKLMPHSSVNITYAPFGGGKSGIQTKNVYKVCAKGAYGFLVTFSIL